MRKEGYRARQKSGKYQPQDTVKQDVYIEALIAIEAAAGDRVAAKNILKKVREKTKFFSTRTNDMVKESTFFRWADHAFNAFEEGYFQNILSDKSRQKLERRKQVQQAKSDSKKSVQTIGPKVVNKFPLNQILYGPPGTGKTYQTARLAVAICDGKPPPNQRDELMQRYNELRSAIRIAFTTFHQSMGYEDFVEGLRPTISAEDGSTGFRLEAKAGIFRNICALAERSRSAPRIRDLSGLADRKFFKMSLGRAGIEDHIYDAALQGGYVTLGWGGDVDWSDNKFKDFEEIKNRWRQDAPDASGNIGHIAQTYTFRSAMNVGDIVIISDGNSKFRAIGEILGDYEFGNSVRNAEWNHTRAVKWLVSLQEPMPVDVIYSGRFSQVSCYQLVKEKVNLSALATILGLNEAGGSDVTTPFVLIIDEINRGNISKIFGELITLLEEDKRLGSGPNELKAMLPYSQEEFGVPNNLYLIGTMNTADRSIALLDTALRRRFRFIEMQPNYDLIDRSIDGIHLGQLLRAINRRIEWVFDRDHVIGHSYLINVHDKQQLDSVILQGVIPLLMEYFYEDWSKVKIVLNDTAAHFLKTEHRRAPPLAEFEDDERAAYIIADGDIPVEAYQAACAIT